MAWPSSPLCFATGQPVSANVRCPMGCRTLLPLLLLLTIALASCTTTKQDHPTVPQGAVASVDAHRQAPGVVTDSVILTSAVIYENKDGIFSRVSFSPDGRWLAAVRETQENDLSASELVLLNLKSSRTEVVVPRAVSKSFATYGATAYSIWWNASIVSIAISDGDVNSGTVSYDTQLRRVVKQEWNKFEGELEDVGGGDIKFSDRRGLAAKISSCFSDWTEDVIESGVDAGHAKWLLPDKTALFQARHVDADQRVWLLDLRACDRVELINPGDNSSPNFRGWLSGGAWFDGHVAFLLNGLRVNGELKQPETSSELFVTVSSDARHGVRTAVSGMPGAHLVQIGDVNGQILLLSRPLLDFCGGRLFAFSAREIREYKFPGATFCDASVTSSAGLLAFVARMGPERTSPRHVVVTRMPK